MSDKEALLLLFDQIYNLDLMMQRLEISFSKLMKDERLEQLLMNDYHSDEAMTSSLTSILNESKLRINSSLTEDAPTKDSPMGNRTLSKDCKDAVHYRLIDQVFKLSKSKTGTYFPKYDFKDK